MNHLASGAEACGPCEVVARMCASWATRDAGLVASFFGADAVYHNMPMEPVHGSAAIRQFVSGFLTRPQHVEFRVLRQVCSGPVVMNERIDRFQVGAAEIAMPVAGVFEVRDGLIEAWRDYFDPRSAAGLT